MGLQACNQTRSPSSWRAPARLPSTCWLLQSVCVPLRAARPAGCRRRSGVLCQPCDRRRRRGCPRLRRSCRLCPAVGADGQRPAHGRWRWAGDGRPWAAISAITGTEAAGWKAVVSMAAPMEERLSLSPAQPTESTPRERGIPSPFSETYRKKTESTPRERGILNPAIPG